MKRFLTFIFILAVPVLVFTGCTDSSDYDEGSGITTDDHTVTEITDNTDNYENREYSPDGTKKTGEMELLYANEFNVEYYMGGYSHIVINDGNEYMLVPNGMEPSNLGFEKCVLIPMPQNSIYLAASSAMDLFMCIDSLNAITCCSTKAEDYSLEEAREKIKAGDICYVGKYSAPDYELLLSRNCSLAIESTMIYHSPKIKEQLENIGIPVLIERSSYECEPLGRMEWIKLYGLLTGKTEEAENFFLKSAEKVNNSLRDIEAKDIEERPGVLFFYITSNGYVSIRKPGDYVTKMIEMAGGKYALNQIIDEEGNNLSTMNISWEEFYLYGKDADILIYNSTIDGGVSDIDELLAKNSLLADFKSVQTGNAWCTKSNMFQESSKVADIIVDLCQVINGSQSDTEFVYRLE